MDEDGLKAIREELSKVSSDKDYCKSIRPTPLPPILDRILTFVEEEKNPVLLFEGTEYLMSQNDYGDVLKLIDSIRPVISTSGGIMIIPLNKKAMTQREFALLTTGMRGIP
ncbi:MAG TPA: DUF835 domain-containing protein [Euryarchaeota archaeon]|nr:DUF835 domain-containing protein [Euryarchaeota archaeon]